MLTARGGRLRAYWRARTNQHYSIFLVSAFSIMASGTLIVFGFLNFTYYQQHYLGFLEIAGGVLIAINILALRFHGDTRFTCHLLIYTILIELLLMLITSGIYNTGIFWFYIFPAAVFYLTGRWGGIAWIGAITLFTTLIAYASLRGTVQMPYSTITVRQMLLSLLVLSVLIYFFEANRERAEDGERHLQSELNKNRLQLAKAQQLAKIGSWEWDTATDTMSCSAELNDIFGAPSDQPITSMKKFLTYITPDERTHVKKIIKDASQRLLTTTDVDFNIHRPDATIRTIRSHISIDLDTYTRHTRLIGTVHDITEEKKLLDSLHERARELEKINTLMIGREVRMAELKKRLKQYETAAEQH